MMDIQFAGGGSLLKDLVSDFFLLARRNGLFVGEAITRSFSDPSRVVDLALFS
jgi:hypothetical protein